jgi:competence protein CoiA
MLSATRQSDDKTVLAYFEKQSNGPFFCLECKSEVVLRRGRKRIDHFAHANRFACERTANESDQHRRCKLEIYRSLIKRPNVRDVALERSLGAVRPDIFAYIDGIPVAIEVQISSLSLDSIIERTIWYHRKGIYVLWLLQWTPKLDSSHYSPKFWEKWIHAAYFGRVYYWIEENKVASYRFEPNLKTVPLKSFHDRNGKRITVGGYSKRSKRYRAAVRGEMFDLARDFHPKGRLWWEGGELKVPDAKLFIDRSA